jgi:putative resolvase
MKLSDWAELEGIHYMTAWRWWKAGKLPVPAHQTASGSIIVEVAADAPGRTAVYARVSSHDQRLDLDRQVSRMVAWVSAQGMSVDEVVTEVGSGMNGHRRRLAKLLADPFTTTVVVEHRGCLARFGVEHLEAALAAHGRKVLVVDNAELDDDLVRDMTEVLTWFCARLYGRRGARNRADKALRCAKADVGPMALRDEASAP